MAFIGRHRDVPYREELLKTSCISNANLQKEKNIFHFVQYYKNNNVKVIISLIRITIVSKSKQKTTVR